MPNREDVPAVPLPYYPWYVESWRASFRVQRMTTLARGIYREILDECWVTGHVPDDLMQLAHLCRCDPREIAAVWVQEIRPCLRPVKGSGDALWESPRLEIERARILGEIEWRKDRASRAGQASAAKRVELKSTIVDYSRHKRREEKKREEKKRSAAENSASGLSALGAQPLAALLKSEFEKGKSGERAS